MTADTFIKNRLDFHSEESGHFPAFIFQDKTISYSELQESISFQTNIFVRSGLNSKTPVLVHLPMGIDQAIILSALLSGGIPALVIPTGTKSVDVLKMTDNFPFQAIITNDSLKEKLGLKISQLQNQHLYGDCFFNRLHPEHPEEVTFSWLLYTSGTTGAPKMVMISSKNLEERTTGEIDLFNLKTHSNILNLLPFSHDLGLNQLLTALHTGSCLEIVVNKLPVELAALISRKKFDSITGMPQIWNNFIQVAGKTGLIIESNGVITISGGSMTSENLKQLKNIFKNATLIKTYGQTETFRSLAEKNQELILTDSNGSEIPGVTVCLLNESGEDCEIGETGELIHTGAGEMSGYWKSESPKSEPGIKTGDYFKKIGSHSYQYAGRKDDMIKHTGRRFFLGEVENCLRNSELLFDVCVVQAEDNRVFSGNDRLVGFIIPKQKSETLLKDLKNFCALNLETYKVPDEFIICESFPLTSSNKIDRRELVKRL